MAIHEVEVRSQDPSLDVNAKNVVTEAAQTLGIEGFQVATADIYRFEGITPEEAEILAKRLLAEPVSGQEFTIDSSQPDPAHNVVEAAYKKQVTDPKVESVMKAADMLGIQPQAARTSRRYTFSGDISPEQTKAIVNRLVVNPNVQEVITEPPETLLIEGSVGSVDIIQVREASDEQLMQLSTVGELHLNLEEMQAIRTYFDQLGRDPTDAEVEIIAGRWSEHCVHKTFKADLIINGERKKPLYTRIKDAAKQYFDKFVLSAFEDNSGVVDFYDGMAICGKVETHNSPSALDPFGGAATGTGGVVRDIAGTGKGAKVISSTDMFCMGPPDMDPKLVPPGCLHPNDIFRGVVSGVQTYGNNMGIPTNNGSVHFHERFRAKPVVIVGAYGILPKERVQKGQAQAGDRAIVVGGKTGRDGIHGATFSSAQMTENTSKINSAAVQIGNPIVQQRMFEALLAARDANLVEAITDCGAAGLSSAVGEMGEETGVEADVSKVPLKYVGLKPWEIWLSEAQERMVVAVKEENVPLLQEIGAKYNTEMTDIGRFNDTKRLTVKHGETVVADLDYEFLTEGLPKSTLVGNYEKIHIEEPEIPEPQTAKEWIDVTKKVLGHLNVCSKEPIVRRYDHTVQGTNAMEPYSGVHHDGPNDAAILTPILGKPYGFVQAHGMNPVLNDIDPYWGSISAIAKACSNYAAVGGNIDEAALINNYIWPTPDEKTLGTLDRSVDAVVDAMHALKRPVVSGKDSLSARYSKGTGENRIVIDIPPVLCMSVFGRIPDVEKTTSADLKKPGESMLFLVGKLDDEMGGSIYQDVHGVIGGEVPKVDMDVLPKVLRGMYPAITSGKVLACHDVSEGGIITTLTEMAFGGDCGIEIQLDENMDRPSRFIFNETAGSFVVEVSSEEEARELFKDLPLLRLGKTKAEKSVTVNRGEDQLFSVGIDELKVAWKEPMQQIF